MTIKIYFQYIGILTISALIFSCKKEKLDVVVPIEKAIIVDTNYPVADSLVIDGYFNKFSFGQGETATIFVNSKTKVDSQFLGIYNVNGKIVDAIKISLSIQKVATVEPYLNGFGYIPTATVTIPKSLKSGLYFIAKKIPFLVKNTGPVQGDFLIIHPSHNDIAYNNNGGMSYYLPSHQVRARVLSTQRPWKIAENGNPIPFYQWILSKGYKVDFACDDEMQDYENIKKYNMMVIAGHSEYWTRPARETFDKFIDNGKNALMLTGNTMYWQTRFSTTKQQLTCYKYDAQSADPTTDPLLKTDRWEAATLKYNELNSIGLNFYTSGGYITIRAGDPKGFTGYKIIQPDFPIFKNTNLAMNDTLIHNSIEYDGAKVKFVSTAKFGSVPVYDNSATKFYKVDILGWDYARPDYGVINNNYNIALFIIMKKKSTSGLILNMSSSNWCNEILKVSRLQTITENSIDFLLKNYDYSMPVIQ